MARVTYGSRQNMRKSFYFVVILIIAAGLLAYILKLPPFAANDESIAEVSLPQSEAPAPLEPVVIEKTAPAVSETAAPAPLPAAIPQDSQAVTDAVILTDTNNPYSARILEVQQLMNERPARVIQARTILNELLATVPMTSEQRQDVKRRLSDLADMWLFSSTVYPEDKLCTAYRVRPGDTLVGIGNKFNVPHGIIMEINRILSPSNLRADSNIKVINGPFHARVNRSQFVMDLYLQDVYVRSFKVGLARPPHETPTGMWRVKADGKLISPRWTDPDTGKVYEPTDPDYPLGSRWIGLEGLEGDAKGRAGYAIHGTNDMNSIGSASSRGCVRLYNGDAILMYNILQGGISQVQVVD